MNISYKRIISIAIPVVFANLAMPIQNLIDTAIVGHFNDPFKLAGLGLSMQVIALLLVSFNFLQYASSGLSAQAVGQYGQDNKGANTKLLAILQRALLLALIIGFFLLLLRQWLIPFALKILSANQSNGLVAKQYLEIRFFGFIAELFNYAFLGWFAGMGKTKIMLYLQSFIAVSNIILTMVFVFILNLGIKGVALGTVIAYWLSVLLAFIFVVRHLKVKLTDIFKINWQQPNINALASLLSLNKDIFIRTLLLTLSFAWITKLAAQSGDLVLATHACFLQVLYISAFALDGIAVATETLSGQSYASKNRFYFLQVLKKTGIISYILAIFLSFLWWLFYPQFISLMTNINDIKIMAVQYKWYAIFIPVIGVGAYWLDGVLFGLTAGKEIRKTATLVALMFFPTSYLLYHIFGAQGIWQSVWLILLLRLMILSIFLYKKMLKSAA